MQIKTTCKYTIINTLKKNPDYLQYVVAGYFYHCNISLEIAVAINLVRVWSFGRFLFAMAASSSTRSCVQILHIYCIQPFAERL